MFRGLSTYGGKTFAVYMLGANPATATIVLVGLGASQISGRGFDKFVDYLYATKPEFKEITDIERFIEDDFAMVNDGDKEDRVLDEATKKLIEDFKREESYLENYGRRATNFCAHTYHSVGKTIAALPETLSTVVEEMPKTISTVVKDMPNIISSALVGILSAKFIATLTSVELLSVAGSAFTTNIAQQTFVYIPSSVEDAAQEIEELRQLNGDNDEDNDDDAIELDLGDNGELVIVEKDYKDDEDAIELALGENGELAITEDDDFVMVN